MSKFWSTILFAVLMVVQTLSAAADVLPPHSDDNGHEQSERHHYSGAALTLADLDPEPQNNSEAPGHPPGHSHCHTCHTHAPNLLLAAHPVQLPELRKARPPSSYNADLSVGHISSILRPPIA